MANSQMPDDLTPVLMTREEWDLMARSLHLMIDPYTRAIPLIGSGKLDRIVKINRAICDQAGLEEVFRCE